MPLIYTILLAATIASILTGAYNIKHSNWKLAGWNMIAVIAGIITIVII